MRPVRLLLSRVRGRMIRERALTSVAGGAAVAALGALASQAAARRWPFEPFWPVLLFWLALYWIFIELVSKPRLREGAALAIAAFLLGVYVSGHAPLVLSALGVLP